MASTALFFLLLCFPSLNLALDVQRPPPPHPFWRRASSSRNVPAAGYYPPPANGGSMLTAVSGTFPAGLGEPINLIVSGASDADVLVDSEDHGGLQNYFLSFGFAGECLGQQDSLHQGADLGDGNGYKNETAVKRWDYGDPQLGTCTETLRGGNHFRYWIQDGAKANSGAVFLAASYELPIALQHDIVPNGYNLARDWLLGNITGAAINTSTVSNASTFSGTTAFGGYTYASSIAYVSGLLANTSDGINHFQSVGSNTTNAVDGLVAVVTVQISARPAASSAELCRASWGAPSAAMLGAALAASVIALG